MFHYFISQSGVESIRYFHLIQIQDKILPSDKITISDKITTRTYIDGHMRAKYGYICSIYGYMCFCINIT